MFKKMLLVLLLLAVAFSPLRVEAETFIKGVHTKLPLHQFKFDGKTVEVIEFMSFYCDGCYSFERAIPAIKGNFPKRLNGRPSQSTGERVLQNRERRIFLRRRPAKEKR